MARPSAKPLIYIIAGEASGDLLGARLMSALKVRTDGKVRFAGVGGEAMKGQGLSSLFDNSELAIMGLAEVLPKIPKIFGLINSVIKDIKAKNPAIVITIDSWAFSDRIHRRLRGSPFPHIHYVAPQVWAWRPARAAKMAEKLTALLTLLPFENGYFTKYGLDTVCVGHPVVESPWLSAPPKNFRKAHKIKKDSTILLVLPGSRHNEVGFLLPIFKEATALLARQIPNLQVVIPTLGAVASEVKAAASTWKVPTLVVTGEEEKASAFAAATAALAASGTVSLELALAGVPHIIAYKLSPLSFYFAKKLIKLKYVNLLNIMADKEIIPECLQDDCTGGILACEMMKLLGSKHNALRQLHELKPLLALLGKADEGEGADGGKGGEGGKGVPVPADKHTDAQTGTSKDSAFDTPAFPSTPSFKAAAKVLSLIGK